MGGVRSNPPIQYNPQIFNGTLATLLNSTATLFPGNVTSVERDPHAPTVYSYSLSIEQNIEFRTILNVNYVGSQSRHLIRNRNLNTLPCGARFAPENADLTTPIKSPLPDSFLRPFPGVR